MPGFPPPPPPPTVLSFFNLSHGDPLSGSASLSLRSRLALLLRTSHQKHRHHQQGRASRDPINLQHTRESTCAPTRGAVGKKDQDKLQQLIMQSSAPDDGSAALRIADVRNQHHKTELRREKNLAMAWGLARIRVSLATNDLSDVACVLAWNGTPRRPKLRRPRVGAAHTRQLRSRPPKRFTRADPRRCLPSRPSCLLLRVAEMRARALVEMRR